MSGQNKLMQRWDEVHLLRHQLQRNILTAELQLELQQMCCGRGAKSSFCALECQGSMSCQLAFAPACLQHAHLPLCSTRCSPVKIANLRCDRENNICRQGLSSCLATGALHVWRPVAEELRQVVIVGAGMRVVQSRCEWCSRQVSACAHYGHVCACTRPEA
jgi:hypothetical protein